MSEWNFPCYNPMDILNATAVSTGRDDAGGGFECTGHGITTEMTVVFPILIRSQEAAPFSYTKDAGYDAHNTDEQLLLSIGTKNDSNTPEVTIGLVYNSDTGVNYIYLNSLDSTDGSTRWTYHIGDEDGSSWLSADKWYQVVVTISADGSVDWAVNGSLTPKSTEVAAPSGDPMRDMSAMRIWFYGPYASVNFDANSIVTFPWSSFITGTLAVRSSDIDLTSAAVMDRIYDSNNDFKPAGEDGSLWFGDTYGASTPNLFLLDGSPVFDNGNASATWAPLVHTGATDLGGAPGGYKKEYDTLPDVSSLLTDLVAWWTMDEASGNRADSSGNGYTLTDNNTVGASSGEKVRQCADFEASNSEYLSRGAAEAVFTPTNLTVAMWFNAESDFDGYIATVSNGGSSAANCWQLVRNTAAGHPSPYAGFRLAVSDGSTTTNCDEEDGNGQNTGQWYCIMFTVDTDNDLISLYINNVLENTAAFTGTINSATGPLRLGRRDTAAAYADGKMDEVAIWSRVLTAAERALYYNHGGGRGYPG